MDFPSWVDRHSDDRKKAQARLKYMLSVATLRRFGRPSMHDLAAAAGCNHSSIFNAINRGWFTPQMAEAIERVLGRQELPCEALTNPLEVGRVTQ